MHIGDAHDFLSLERLDVADPYSAFRVEAKAGSDGYQFSARHHGVMADTSETTIASLLRFENLAVDRFELALSENGSIRVKRDSRGHLIVHYRITRSKLAAAMEGELHVHGECANQFCKDLRALLKGSNG